MGSGRREFTEYCPEPVTALSPVPRPPSRAASPGAATVPSRAAPSTGRGPRRSGELVTVVRREKAHEPRCADEVVVDAGTWAGQRQTDPGNTA